MSNDFWEEKYSHGFIQRYPWDAVISFVFNNMPAEKLRHDICILEVGCGTGANLWFAAREGFNVTGIDCSVTAINIVKKRFIKDSLVGNFNTGDFASLPYDDSTFDLIIDRGSITHVGLSKAKDTMAEIYRVMKSGGKLFFNPYSDKSTSSYSGKKIEDGLTINISEGSLKNVGQLCFYNKEHIVSLLKLFKIKSMVHLSKEEMLLKQSGTHAEWHVIAQK